LNARAYGKCMVSTNIVHKSIYIKINNIRSMRGVKGLTQVNRRLVKVKDYATVKDLTLYSVVAVERLLRQVLVANGYQAKSESEVNPCG
jgi:hypothetical protein